MHEGDYDGAQAALNRAMTIARREGDAALEMRSLCHAARVDRLQGRTKEALDKSLRALELAPQANDLASEADAHFQAGGHYLLLGDSDAARYHASAIWAPAEKLGDRFSTLNALLLNIRLSMLVGEWAGAREFSDRALTKASLDARTLFYRIMLEYQEGNFVQGGAYVERLREVMDITTPGPTFDTVLLAMAIPLTARLTGVGERLAIAEMAADAALSSASAAHVTVLAAQCAQALVSLFQGNVHAAEGHYAVLASESGSRFVYGDISVDWVLGLLSQSIGEMNQSIVHLEDALVFCRKAGYRPEVAWTCCDYADVLLQRGGHGDTVKAMTVLEESLSISTELGMIPLTERVVDLQELVTNQPVRAPQYPDGLTQREVEVLRLVAAGKTDREIAEELFISTRTVTTHVSNLLNKTNAANRAEAATYASRHGLV